MRRPSACEPHSHGEASSSLDDASPISGFSCPRCLGAIAASDDVLLCTRCKARYRKHEGIADFRVNRHDYYFNPVPRDEMAAIARMDATTSWDEMVRHFLRFVKNVPDWIDNIAVNGRYTWKLFLALPPAGRLLDVGCGLGNLASNLAPNIGEVVALDLTWERLEFARQRFAKFNSRDRITLVAGGDAAHLPFPDAHFDAISLSGVLEWIADDVDTQALEGSRAAKVLQMLMTFFGERNPRRTQQRFLAELRRVLKPDGQLFVAIENRWGYEYFLGRPDHHSGLLGGSLLPRLAANAYSILRNHRPYRTYTYTYAGLRRLFGTAGFVRSELYGLSPGYSGVAEILPAATDQPFWQPRTRSTVFDRLATSARFVPAFGIIAQPARTRLTPLVARLLDHISQSLPGTGPIALHDCRVTGKDKVVLAASAGDKRLILKLPTDEATRIGESTHARVIAALAPRNVRLAPEPLGNGTFQGIDWFLERRLPGAALAVAEIGREAAVSQVADFIQRMAIPAPQAAAPDTDAALMRSLVVDPIEKLRNAGVDRSFIESIARLEDEIASKRWSLGLAHGDLSVSNLFVDGGELAGAIDWEYANEHGLPALDMIAYLESRQRLADPTSTVAANLLRLARGDWPCEPELAALHRIYAQYGIDYGKQHATMCLLAWLAHAARQLDTTARFDPRAIARLVEPIRSEFARTAT